MGKWSDTKHVVIGIKKNLTACQVKLNIWRLPRPCCFTCRRALSPGWQPGTETAQVFAILAVGSDLTIRSTKNAENQLLTRCSVVEILHGFSS